MPFSCKSINFSIQLFALYYFSLFNMTMKKVRKVCHCVMKILVAGVSSHAEIWQWLPAVFKGNSLHCSEFLNGMYTSVMCYALLQSLMQIFMVSKYCSMYPDRCMATSEITSKTGIFNGPMEPVIPEQLRFRNLSARWV
jgi:hypothetical protein